MVSDQDPTGEIKTHRQMYWCNLFNTLLPVAMSAPSIGLIHPYVLLPYFAYQAKTFQALNQFKKEKASVNSAKQVKKTAYMPFMILLMGFFGTTFNDRFNERRKRDNEVIIYDI